MIDIVTVVFKPELEILKLQARSLDQYVEGIKSIKVVINQDTNLESQIDRCWWGSYHDRVQIIQRNQFGSTWSDNGWVSQQALKIMTAAICDCEWAVILDAKTIFVRPFEPLPHRPAVGQLNIYPVFEHSREIANQLFGIDLQHQLGPGGVPFIINTQHARDMIVWIQNHTKQSFADWFQQQGRLTEFILYSAWIQYRTGSLNIIYNTETTNIVPVNLCHSEVERFEQKLSQMPAATTVSIHRNAWTQLADDHKKQYMDFLHSRGIQ